MKIFQSTVAVCLALICVTLATATVTPCGRSCDAGQIIYEADLTTRESEIPVFQQPVIKVEEQRSTLPQESGSCNAQRLLKVTFPPATSNVQELRLKLIMEMDNASPLRDHSFHVADNDGAPISVEVYNVNDDWRVNPIDVAVAGVIQPSDTVEVIIGDEYLEYTSSNGASHEYCDSDIRRLLFALRGQTSPSGPSNYDIYIAFNMPISGSTPDSALTGVCYVQMLALTCE